MEDAQLDSAEATRTNKQPDAKNKNKITKKENQKNEE